MCHWPRDRTLEYEQGSPVCIGKVGAGGWHAVEAGARIQESDSLVFQNLIITRSKSTSFASPNLKLHIHQMGITSLPPDVAGSMLLSSTYKLWSTYYVKFFA